MSRTVQQQAADLVALINALPREAREVVNFNITRAGNIGRSALHPFEYATTVTFLVHDTDEICRQVPEHSVEIREALQHSIEYFARLCVDEWAVDSGILQLAGLNPDDFNV